jgi:hypothetical protein
MYQRCINLTAPQQSAAPASGDDLVVKLLLRGHLAHWRPTLRHRQIGLRIRRLGVRIPPSALRSHRCVAVTRAKSSESSGNSTACTKARSAARCPCPATTSAAISTTCRSRRAVARESRCAVARCPCAAATSAVWLAITARRAKAIGSDVIRQRALPTLRASGDRAQRNAGSVVGVTRRSLRPPELSGSTSGSGSASRCLLGAGHDSTLRFDADVALMAC